MSYCRFSESDLYLFDHVGGYTCCMCCRLTPKDRKTIFTTGLKEGEHPIFNNGISACEECGGEGCESCCMHGDVNMETYEEVIAHVKKHILAGHRVPGRVIPRLEFEARLAKCMKSTRFRRNRVMMQHWKKVFHCGKHVRKISTTPEHITNRTPANSKRLALEGMRYRRFRRKMKKMREQLENDRD